MDVEKVGRRFWSHVDVQVDAAACWPWTAAASPLGYGRFNVGVIDGKKRIRVSSRVAWELTNGPIPPGLKVLHRCDNPPCVNPAHLFLGTDADNIHDCMRKGRFRPSTTRGMAQKQSKLTDDYVREIRAAHSQGARPIALARKYGVDPKTIQRVVQRSHWKHVA